MFTKFKILLKQIFNRKISYTYKRLVRNIKTGDIIEVNGKKYRKIKITFVDSMSYTVSNHLDNLESEIHVLNEQLVKADTEIEKLNEQKIALQYYNNNLIQKEFCTYSEGNRKLEKIKTENELLNKRICELESLIPDLRKKNHIQQNQIKKQQEIQAENELLNKRIVKKDETITSLSEKINAQQNQIKKQQEIQAKTDSKIKKQQEIQAKTTGGDVKNYSDGMIVLLKENMSLKSTVSTQKQSIENLFNKAALLQDKINMLEAANKK